MFLVAARLAQDGPRCSHECKCRYVMPSKRNLHLKFSIKIMSLRLPSGSLNSSYSCKIDVKLHPDILRRHPITHPVFFCPVIQKTSVGWLDSSEMKSTAFCTDSSNIDTNGSWLEPMLNSAKMIDFSVANSLRSLFSSFGHKQTKDLRDRLFVM